MSASGPSPAQRAAGARRMSVTFAAGAVFLMVAGIVMFVVDLKVPAYLAGALGVLDLVLASFALSRAKAADREADAAGPVIQEQ